MYNQQGVWKKSSCEYIRNLAKQRFDKCRSTWLDCGRWAAPHKIRWMLSQTEGERNNQHIVDTTHILALRSYVAGFLEGNTSATRPWFRIGTSNPDINQQESNKVWLDLYARRILQVLSQSNFYHAAGGFYYEYGVFNTGAHYIDELRNGLYFHNLTPGSYYVLNNGYGEAVTMVREFSLTVKAIVDTYGKKVKGVAQWDNFSPAVKKMYEDGNYTQMVDVVHVINRNENFDVNKPIALANRQWVSLTYEVGGQNAGQYYQDGQEFGAGSVDPTDPREEERFLKVSFSRRKPFIVGKSESSNNFEYGEKGPTLDALGLIKSLNKKAISKDMAIEQMLRPGMQGPANLRKSYITTNSNSYIPLDPTSMKPGGGMRPLFEMNPAIAPLLQDQTDLRQQVDKLFYSDYLLYLSQNPKTRTATETDAIVKEQQLVIGPNLQSLNWTYNVPVLDFVMDYTLHEDPYLPPPPDALAGNFLRPEFISVFAQAQKAADLPSIDRYVAMISNVGQLNPAIWDKANLDKLADIYEDRLFLPAGLNNPQGKVDAKRLQAQAMAQRQQMMQETIPAMAGAAKDVGIKINNKAGG